jgi:hypothetical protein
MIQTNYRCTSRKPREDTKAYKIAKRLVTYLPEYQRTWGSKPSPRTVFYGLQDEHIITRNDDGLFTEVTVQARLGWVDTDGNLLYPKIPLDAFSDADDHSKIIDLYDNSSPIDPEDPLNPEDHIQYLIDEVKQAEKNVDTARQAAEDKLTYTKQRMFAGPDDYDGVGESGRRGGLWYDQPEYVEAWEEKVDLVDNFKGLLKDWKIKIRGNGGYPSLMFLNLCCVQLNDVIERSGLEPEHIHILYCGDQDPSGLGIDYYIQKRLKQLGIEGIDFKRIAVLDKHIKQFNLPLMNIKKDPNKKAPNPNLATFRLLYGDRATHLNALMTLKHKKHFKTILDEAIKPHWDEDIYNDMVDEYEADPPERDDVESDREMMRDMIEEAGYSEDDTEARESDE